MSWRVDDVLLERVRRVATEHGWSMNEYVTRVLDAATDPDLADTGLHRTRARLAAAGLLAPSGPPRRRPSAAELERAREAARQVPGQLSDLVREGRG